MEKGSILVPDNSNINEEVKYDMNYQKLRHFDQIHLII